MYIRIRKNDFDLTHDVVIVNPQLAVDGDFRLVVKVKDKVDAMALKNDLKKVFDKHGLMGGAA